MEITSRYRPMTIAVLVAIACVLMASIAAGSTQVADAGDTIDRAEKIVVCTGQQHGFEEEGDVDWFKFRAWAGVEYTIRTYDLSPINATRLCLYDSDYTLLECDYDPENAPASRIDRTLPADGTYFIRVTHPKLQGGPGFDYSIHVGESEFPCTDDYEPDDQRDQAEQIPVGDTQRRTFHGYCGGDVDWVTFDTVTDTVYTIETSRLSGDNDTVLALYNADGVTVTVNDDGLYNCPASRIDWQAPDSGTYYIKVTPFNPLAGGCGLSYDLTVEESATLPTSEPTSPVGDCVDGFEPDDSRGESEPIEVNTETQDHTFDGGGDEDWVKFWAFAGNEYTIRTFDLSDGNDTVLCLYRWDGWQLECNDDIDPPGDLASEITWTFDENGTYYVRVTHANPSVPGCFDYKLKVTSTVPCSDRYEPDDAFGDAQPISVGQPQVHNFHVPCILCGEHPADDADWVWFQAQEGSPYKIRTSNLEGDNDIVLCLYDDDMNELVCNDDELDDGQLLASVIDWEAPADGKYYLKASPFDRRFGGCDVAYTLQVDFDAFIYLPLVLKRHPPRCDFSTSSKSVDPAACHRGERLRYAITLRNTGNLAGSAALTDPIPSGTTYVPGSVRGESCEYNGAADQVQCSSVPVDVDASRVVEFEVQVDGCPTVGEIVNQVTIDGCGSVFTREATTTILPPPQLPCPSGLEEVGPVCSGLSYRGVLCEAEQDEVGGKSRWYFLDIDYYDSFIVELDVPDGDADYDIYVLRADTLQEAVDDEENRNRWCKSDEYGNVDERAECQAVPGRFYIRVRCWENPDPDPYTLVVTTYQ